SQVEERVADEEARLVVDRVTHPKVELGQQGERLVGVTADVAPRRDQVARRRDPPAVRAVRDRRAAESDHLDTVAEGQLAGEVHEGPGTTELQARADLPAVEARVGRDLVLGGEDRAGQGAGAGE